jgi:hypothetical protein
MFSFVGRPGGIHQGIRPMLSAETVIAGTTSLTPPQHHPITCSGDTLEYDIEDDRLTCEHGGISGDERTQACLNKTIAVLLFECAWEMFGGPVSEDSRKGTQ